jgi:hypothetical protein
MNNKTVCTGGDTSCKIVEDALVSIRSSEIKPNDDKDMKCAPSKKFEHGSCIPLNILVEMANAYNADNPNNKIVLSTTHETVNPEKYKKYLVKQFKTKLTKCTNQSCWTKQPFMKRLNNKIQDDIRNNTLRPKGPETKSTWLNTTHIDTGMKQYENKYKDFLFLGAVPIDFDDIPDYGIKDLNLKKLMESGKSKLGIIFNTDPHYKSGQHWIAAYADLKKGESYYFDSYGVPPEKEVRKFMKRIANFIKKDQGKEPIIDYNRMQHQRGNVDCGVYSMAFILRLLKGDSFDNINTNRVPDKEINQCREVYFT